MKTRTVLAVTVTALVIASLAASLAWGQLVVADKDVKVVKVDVDKMRIEICSLTASDPNNTDGYVYVTDQTKAYRDGKPFDWKDIKKGWIIRAKGGVRFDMNVNAKKIWVIKTQDTGK